MVDEWTGCCRVRRRPAGSASRWPRSTPTSAGACWSRTPSRTAGGVCSTWSTSSAWPSDDGVDARSRPGWPPSRPGSPNSGRTVRRTGAGRRLSWPGAMSFEQVAELLWRSDSTEAAPADWTAPDHRPVPPHSDGRPLPLDARHVRRRRSPAGRRPTRVDPSIGSPDHRRVGGLRRAPQPKATIAPDRSPSGWPVVWSGASPPCRPPP